MPVVKQGPGAWKTALDELAILGGTPAFAEPLHVGRPNIGDRKKFEARMTDVLDRRWLTNDGHYVNEFEQRVAAFVGVEHCVAICNGTVALEIAIRALGLRGEVIVPSFTFIATAHALQWQKITPVFCDIDPRTHTLDPDRVEQMITPRTTGIIPVHVFGRPCEVDALSEIAARRGLKLLFDSAHAIGCSCRGRMIGGFGDAEVFSFHATKIVNSLEGGAVVTNDVELAQKVRLMKNFGFTDYDRTDYVGTNGKMNEISAAMGLTNLESLSDFIAVNQRNYKQYRQELSGLPGLSLMGYDEGERHNYQYIIVEIDEAVTHVSRDQLIKLLHAENVLARRYFYPGCHRMEPYCSYFPNAGLVLPVTERLVRRVLSLPNGTAVGEAEIAGICSLLRLAIEHGEHLRTLL
jgi:dTDP-4-amino-4,6-dideoxygalactose transaminase